MTLLIASSYLTWPYRASLVHQSHLNYIYAAANVKGISVHQVSPWTSGLVAGIQDSRCFDSPHHHVVFSVAPQGSCPVLLTSLQSPGSMMYGSPNLKYQVTPA